MTLKRVTLAWGLIAVLTLGGCVAHPSDPIAFDELTGTWEVEPTAAAPAVPLTLELTDDGLIAWNDSCKAAGQWATLDGAFLARLGPVDGACWGGSTRENYLEWLDTAAWVSMDDGMVVLTDTSGSVAARLTAIPEADPPTIVPMPPGAEPGPTARELSATPAAIPEGLTPTTPQGRWAVPTQPDLSVVFTGSTWALETPRDAMIEYCGTREGRFVSLDEGRILTSPPSETLIGDVCLAEEAVWLMSTRLTALDGEELVLLSADAIELGRLVPSERQRAEIENTGAYLLGTWTVTEPGSGDAPPTVSRVTFGRGSWSAQFDCGIVEGAWAAAELTFIATHTGGSMGCTDGVGSEASLGWLNAIRATRHAPTTFDDFRLLGADGAVLAELSEPVPHERPDSPQVDETYDNYVYWLAPLPPRYDVRELLGRWIPVGPDAGAAYLELSPEEWRASDGCNSAGGLWADLGDGFVIATPQLIGTAMGCPGVDVSTWIGAARTGGFDGDTLVLFDGAGQEIGRLVRG